MSEARGRIRTHVRGDGVVSTLRSGIEEFRSADLDPAPDGVLEEDLAELVAVSEALEAEILRRLVIVERRRSFARDGFFSTISWLVARFKMSRSRAADLVLTARSMQHMA